MHDRMERDPEVTHKIMAAIPSKDTKPELLLRRKLWHRNLRYRVNFKKLPGKPDIVFTRYHIAIFCDGDFWHGHNWAIRGLQSLDEELNSYNEFWRTKILNNIKHDKEINQLLENKGWMVIRFWESDIKKDVEKCADQIVSAIKRVKQ